MDISSSHQGLIRYLTPIRARVSTNVPLRHCNSAELSRLRAAVMQAPSSLYSHAPYWVKSQNGHQGAGHAGARIPVPACFGCRFDFASHAQRSQSREIHFTTNHRVTTRVMHASDNEFHTIVVGIGAHGSAALYQLAKRGCKVNWGAAVLCKLHTITHKRLKRVSSVSSERWNELPHGMSSRLVCMKLCRPMQRLYNYQVLYQLSSSTDFTSWVPPCQIGPASLDDPRSYPWLRAHSGSIRSILTPSYSTCLWRAV